MAGKPTPKGSWGDWAVIEKKPRYDKNSCSVCVFFCEDGSCKIHPFVIKDVGYDYRKQCDDYYPNEQAKAAQDKKVQHQLQPEHDAKRRNDCKHIYYSQLQKSFYCMNKLSQQYSKKCVGCSYYEPSSPWDAAKPSLDERFPDAVTFSISLERKKKKKLHQVSEDIDSNATAPLNPKKSSVSPKTGCIHIKNNKCEITHTKCTKRDQHCLFFKLKR